MSCFWQQPCAFWQSRGAVGLHASCCEANCMPHDERSSDASYSLRVQAKCSRCVPAQHADVLPAPINRHSMQFVIFSTCIVFRHHLTSTTNVCTCRAYSNRRGVMSALC